jgi:hypothetical protein
MDAAPPPAGVSLGDLSNLTLRGNVAFAARCARRIRPLVHLPDDAPARAARLQALDAAQQLAEDFARGEEVPAGLAQGVAAAAHEVAEDIYEVAGFAAYAPAHAVRGVFQAARAARGEASFVEVIAAAFGASRVLIVNGGSGMEPFILAALRADFEALLRLRLGRPGELGASVDASEAGPLGTLWPAGTPPWYP